MDKFPIVYVSHDNDDDWQFFSEHEHIKDEDMNTDELEIQINNLFELAKEENAKGNFKESFNYLKKAWDILPEPKKEVPESFHIIKYIVQLSLRNNKEIIAKEWIKLIYKCDEDRIDDGEREYLEGRVEFALQDFESAKRLFKTAFKKSEGRIPGSEEKEYIKLVIE